ncbi:hypothetical protein SMMN14_09245 [Sphaerulina musiva]
MAAFYDGAVLPPISPPWLTWYYGPLRSTGARHITASPAAIHDQGDRRPPETRHARGSRPRQSFEGARHITASPAASHAPGTQASNTAGQHKAVRNAAVAVASELLKSLGGKIPGFFHQDRHLIFDDADFSGSSSAAQTRDDTSRPSRSTAVRYGPMAFEGACAQPDTGRLRRTRRRVRRRSKTGVFGEVGG